MKITKYTTAKGAVRFEVFDYLGLDLYGKAVRVRKKGFKSKKEAKDYLKEKQEEFNSNHKLVTNNNIYQVRTFDELFNLWYGSYKTTVKPSTAFDKLSRYNRVFKETLGKVKVTKITPILIQDIINDIANRYSSYQEYVPIINLPLEYAVQLEIISKNPCSAIIYPKATVKNKYQHKSKNNIFNREELKTFLEVCNQIDIKYYTYYRILAFTGLRPAEALALQFNDIQGNLLSVSKTTYYDRANKEVIITSPKTKGSKRTINIDDTTKQAINDYRTYQIEQGKLIKDSSFIFTTKKGTLYSSANLISWLNTIYRHCPNSLPRLTNHNFRKTHASLLLQSGVNIKYIQKRLGHKDIKTTLNIYTHLTSDMDNTNLQGFMDYLNF